MSLSQPIFFNKGSSNVNNYLLLTCFVYADGEGDLRHFIDIANSQALKKFASTEEKQDFNPEIIGLVAFREKSMDYLVDYINSQKLPFPIIFLPIPDKQFPETLDFRKLDENKINFFQELITEEISAYKIRSLNLAIHVSVVLPFLTETLELLYPSVLNIVIGEHGMAPPKISPHTIVTSMGFARNALGLLLEDKPCVQAEKYQFLASITDKDYLSILTGHSTPPSNEELEAICKEFLQKNLLVPCFFQHPQALMTAIISISQAFLDDYEGIVFHLSGCKDTDLTPLLKDNFEVIEEDAIETVVEHSLSSKKIRILYGFRLNDSDYGALLSSAQKIMGCSGDKSLESALLRGLVPFYEVRPWKKEFVDSFIDLVEEDNIKFFLMLCSFLENPEKLAEFSENGLFTHIYPLLKKDNFFIQWEGVIKNIKNKFNLYDKLPIIFAILNCGQIMIKDRKNLEEKNKIKSIFKILIEGGVINFFYQNSQLSNEEKIHILREYCESILTKPNLLRDMSRVYFDFTQFVDTFSTKNNLNLD